jgi:alcohol dehydrogenase (cytochrome c)
VADALGEFFGSQAASPLAVPPSAGAVPAGQSAAALPERPPDPPLNHEVATYTPVTNAMLLNPDPNEWINWRRTLDGRGYSPLKQITTHNAHQLQLAWSWGLGVGQSQPTPLVHSGVMYVPSPTGVVQALDAETGEFIWENRKSFETPPRILTMMRNIALDGDKVFVAMQDAHLVALNARTVHTRRQPRYG